MDTYIVFLDRYPARANPSRVGPRVMIGLIGVVLSTLTCIIGPSLSVRSAAISGLHAATASEATS